MEMGKLTAKLRDAVPVCLLVEGREVKRYKNIEIPDDLKKLEYMDFRFDVPLNGTITFKIMFEPGVLPEEFPQMRERRTRKLLPQEAQPQEVATMVDVAVEAESQPQDEQPTENLPGLVAKTFVLALEDSQAAYDKSVAMVDSTTIKTKVIEDGSEGRLLVITTEMENTEAATGQPESDEHIKKPSGQAKGKKRMASSEDASK